MLNSCDNTRNSSSRAERQAHGQSGPLCGSSPPDRQEQRRYALANFSVHSLAVCMAAFWSSFHRWATSLASGSSGFGAPRSAWMDSRMVRICRAGDQFPFQSRRVSQGRSGRGGRGRTFEHVEADAAEPVDVGVVDLGQEAHLGGRHGVVFRQEELELEGAACCLFR
jgi:hypothetical protein